MGYRLLLVVLVLVSVVLAVQVVVGRVASVALGF